MFLKIQRSQRQGGMLGGKIFFGLNLRAEYTRQEHADISKYRLGSQNIYSSVLDSPASKINASVTIDSLAKDLAIECQNISELQQLESAIIAACKDLQNYLRVAESFYGREILVDFTEPAAASAQAAE